MTTQDFNPGDVVQLKSGGPKMTCEGEAYGGDLLCSWFDGNKREQASFPAAALKRAEEKSAIGAVRGRSSGMTA